MVAAAVAGTGFIGPAHIEALRRIGIGVTGILGSSKEKSQQAAQQLGLARAYSDYLEIIEDPEVDVVHITTPNNWHFAMSSRALKANKHVVCEKPLAMTAKETAALAELARSKPKLISAVNYNIRFYPIVI